MHCNKDGFKTDAPSEVLGDVFRAWCAEHPPVQPPSSDSAAGIMLAPRERTVSVDFSEAGVEEEKKALHKLRGGRFLGNPEKNWGPKSAATGYVNKEVVAGAEESAPKRKKLN